MLQRRIASTPPELTFEDLDSNTQYTQQFLLTNTTATEQEVTLRPCPTLDRDYEIFPSEFRLLPKDSKSVKISVVTSKPGTYRDVVHIITPTFSEKLYVNLQPHQSTNSHFQALVKDKDEQLQSSQSRIERLEEEIEELNEKLRISNTVIAEKDRVEQELVRVQQENSELRAIIEELRRGEVYNEEFKELVNQKVPSLNSLIELTLRQEQEKNERKNQKVLEILQIKDSLIEDLEEKCEELNNALVLMQHKLNDNKVLLTNTEKSLQGTQKVIEDLKTSNFEKDQTIQSFKQKGMPPSTPKEDVAILKNELLKNFDHIKHLTSELQKYEQENSKLREREEYVLELSKRQSKIREDHERLLKDKDQVLTELRSKVSMQTEHIETLVSKLSQMNYSEVLHKLSSLEEENKILSKRLAESQNSSLTFKKEDLDDGNKVVYLETENEKLQASLKEYTDRSQQLEEQLSQRNREIIHLQNEIIEHKRFRSEMILKAAPSPQEDMARLASSLRQEQSKVQGLETEVGELRSKAQRLELSNQGLNGELQSLCENLEFGRFEIDSQNKLIHKINARMKILKEKEEEALKAAALAEEGLKILQVELTSSSKSDVVKELKRLQTELIQAKSKNDILASHNLKLKEELEDKKQIILSMQFLVNKEDKPSTKKLRKKIRVPPKIVKALLTAKLGESEAVKKLKQASKYEQDLKSQLQAKEETIKRLKKDLQTATVLQSSESSAGYASELDENIQRKLLALEYELNELRDQELHAWETFQPLSLTSQDPPGRFLDDTELLIEGILFLIDQLAYPENDSKSESIEKAQRVVIRALSKALQNDDEKFAKAIGFVPSREEDRNIWYLEVLEQHFNIFTGFVNVLGETTQKLTGDNSYSVATSAGFKGIYVELTKNAKVLIEEVNLIYLLCKLVRNDCERVTGKSQGNDIKRLLDEEVEKVTIQKTSEIIDLKKENQKLRTELSNLQQKLESTLLEYKNVQHFVSQHKSKVTKLENEKQELQQAVESLCKELKEETQLKEQAMQRVDKLHSELKDWQKSQIDILTDRERTIIELQSQIKVLREEQLGTLNENLGLCKQSFDTHSDPVMIQELNSLQDQNSDLQKKVFDLSQALVDERQKLLTRISELEELCAYSDKQKTFLDDSPGNYTIKKDQSIQLASLQALLREKITALDEETRKRIECENKLRSILMTESAVEQRMSKMEAEFVTEISKLQQELARCEKMLKETSEERDAAMEKFVRITEAFKMSTESLKKAEQEIFALQEEQKNQVSKYANKLKTSDTASVELKGKVKELYTAVEGFQKENSALHEHLGALEKEFEVTSMRLEDCEKINSSLKHKLKEYEQKIEDLEEMRVMENNGNSTRYEQLRLELKVTYEDFEKTIEQYEGQISSLKEQIFNELKGKKSKKPLETVDFMLQVAKKDAVIKSLKTELKSVKPKKPEKKVKKIENISAEEEILSLQNQNFKLKAQIKNLESQLQLTREEFERLSQEPKVIEVNPKRDIQEIERRHRLDLQKLAEEVAKLREKWHSPEEWAQLVNNNKDLELTIRRLSDELSRKKEIVENLKAIKDQQDSENCIIQEELEAAKDYSEKMKKLRNEMNRKEKMVCELKSALESSKETEKKVLDDNYQMAEKIKSFKNETARKDAIIKELKSKLENQGQESFKVLAEEADILKDKIKKLKSDCERKDIQVKTLKTKLETAELELETLQAEKQNLSTDAFANLEKELKKNERLLSQLRKTEAQFQSLLGITRKIFKELTESVDGLKSKTGPGIDKEYYSDCMDILNMDMKDLSEFVGQRSVGTTLCRIERLLEQGEDTGEILQIFSQLLEERLDLERSGVGKGRKIEKSRSSKIKN